jgi:hypothetical protein
MKTKEIVIFNASNPESLKKKFKHNEENPRATFINSSNKEALKAALKGNVKNVINYDDDLDLRKLKGDEVVKGKKPAAKKPNKVVDKVEKKKPVAKKKAAAKKNK